MNKKLNFFLFPLFFCCFAFPTKAQPTIDTIKQSLEQKPKIFGKVDSRNSFIDNSRAKVFGLKIGLNFNNRLHFGIGYNQLYSSARDFEKKIYYTNPSNIRDSTTAKLNLTYFSIHTEYVYYQTKRWKLSIPLLIGVGQTSYQYQEMEKKKTIERKTVFVYEPSVSVEYKVLKWFGVGTGIGFRFMATDSKFLNQKFNSPTYSFKILIYYSELFKAFYSKKKKQMAEKEGN